MACSDPTFSKRRIRKRYSWQGDHLGFIGELGDCSQDSNLNVLDVIFIINNCIFSTQEICATCSDIDQNDTINVLDVITLINIILQIN